MSAPVTNPSDLTAESSLLRPPKFEDAGVSEPPKAKALRLRAMTRIVNAQKRERIKLLQELGHIRGFLPLLMKRRNGQSWTPGERATLLLQFRSAAHVSPYLAVLLLPGSFVIVPVLAWWLDRRRQLRDNRLDE